MYQAFRLIVGLVAFVAGVIVFCVFVKPWADTDGLREMGAKLWGSAAVLPLIGFSLWALKRDEAGRFGGGNRRPPIDQGRPVDTGTGRPGF